MTKKELLKMGAKELKRELGILKGGADSKFFFDFFEESLLIIRSFTREELDDFMSR